MWFLPSSPRSASEHAPTSIADSYMRTGNALPRAMRHSSDEATRRRCAGLRCMARKTCLPERVRRSGTKARGQNGGDELLGDRVGMDVFVLRERIGREVDRRFIVRPVAPAVAAPTLVTIKCAPGVATQIVREIFPDGLDEGTAGHMTPHSSMPRSVRSFTPSRGGRRRNLQQRPTSNTAEAYDTHMADTSLSHRIRSEFMEMPGLSLTSAQAARLWAVDPETTQRVLDELAVAGFLCRNSAGFYLRRTAA